VAVKVGDTVRMKGGAMTGEVVSIRQSPTATKKSC
jgi:DNA-directed RNA polymerase subunit H (RpoH/RPB5)